MNPRFYFSSCQIGAEKAVKAEIAREFPRLRFAFSRPGFITFKEAEAAALPLVSRRSVFTRLWGEALGQAKDRESLAALIAGIPTGAVVQCFDRDEYVPGEEPPSFVRHGRIWRLLSECGLPIPDGAPQPGEAVYSLIWIDDFHVFLGRHVRSDILSAEGLSGLHGNIVDIPLPAASPSRAYLKIEEAIYRFKPDVRDGMTALELGCAPGGASTALLARGLWVTGVDPQYMAPSVFSHPRFTSIRKETRHLMAEDLKRVNPDWLVMDMSLAPLEALDQLSYALSLLVKNFGPELRLRGGFLTVKMNDWDFVSSIPLYLKRIGQMGFRDLCPLQLCSNRREFFVWAPRFTL